MDKEDKQMIKEFTCTACLKLILHPIVLTCGHIICYPCYFELDDRSYLPSCPSCKQTITHLPDVCEVIQTVTQSAFPKSYYQRVKNIIGFQNFCDDYPADLISELRTLLRCPRCRELLSHPTVFACGHVCCERCVTRDKENDCYKCVVCETPQWSSKPAVCASLHRLIEGTLLEEVQRKDTIKFVHVDIRCFNCRVQPIIGDCYVCKKCEFRSIIGLKCCSRCFEILTKHPEQLPRDPCHRDDHDFRLSPSINVRNKILLVARQEPKLQARRRPKSIVYCYPGDAYVFSFEGLDFNGERGTLAVEVTIEEDGDPHH